MAHAHTELRLSDGLNVLIGPNNIGKSSIAVALKILARNSNSSFVMQHDQKECSILVETSEGHVIQWTKRKSPSYTINGQTKDRLGRGGTPPELDTTLRLAPVEFEDKEFEPHFGDQKSPIFLINRPASQIAQFFSTTSDAERLVAMQRLHQKNRADAASRSKLVQEENNNIQNELDVLNEVPQLATELERLETERSLLNQRNLEILELQEFIQRFAWLVLDHQVEHQKTLHLNLLASVPFQHPTQHLDSTIRQVEYLQNQLEFLTDSGGTLAQIEVPPELNDTRPLERILHDLGKTTCDQNHAAVVMTECVNLSVPPEYLPIEPLAKFISDFSKCNEDFHWSVDLVSQLETLEKPPLGLAMEPICDVIEAYENQEDVLEHNRKLLLDIAVATKQLECDAGEWLQSHPACLQCGGPLTMDSVRWKSHQHSNIPPPHTATGRASKGNSRKLPTKDRAIESPPSQDME